jgi:hypothetical protein
MSGSKDGADSAPLGSSNSISNGLDIKSHG